MGRGGGEGRRGERLEETPQNGTRKGHGPGEGVEEGASKHTA